MNLPSSPAPALPLIEHLSMWGEVSAYEVRKLGGSAAAWLEILGEAGVVEEVRSETGETIAWALTRSGEALLDAQPDGAARLAMFQVPAYRGYLVGILAEGLALAAKADMREQLEAWTGGELSALLPEINAALDTVEESRMRLVDGGRADVETRCSALPGRNTDYGTWDQVLLGRAGRPQDLFDFVLRKFAPLATLPPASRGDGAATVLRALPPASEDGMDRGQALRPCAWNIRRQRVKSGVPLFDEQGHFLHDPDLPAKDVLRRAFPDALVEHPFYRAVVNLAICAWRSPATTMPLVALRLLPGSDLGDVKLVVGARDAGLLRDSLPRLVCLQGVRSRGLPNHAVLQELMANVLRNLLEFELLVQIEDELRLHPDFQRSLVAQPRLGTVYRPGKDIQKRMLEALIVSLPATSGGHP